jgi:DNA-binding CsgD family transcriptional regulator
MSLLSRLRDFLNTWNAQVVEKPRIFLQDEKLVTAVRELAAQQSRPEEEIVSDFTRMGLDQLHVQSDLENRWSSLTYREQQVAALICLGHRNYEIAGMLAIAPETVKTHLQSIFAKFGLRSSKELRLVLKAWDFNNWWERNQHP